MATHLPQVTLGGVVDLAVILDITASPEPQASMQHLAQVKKSGQACNGCGYSILPSFCVDVEWVVAAQNLHIHALSCVCRSSHCL